MSGSAEHRLVTIDRMETIVEWIVDLGLDEPAADPQSTGPFAEGAGVDPARKLVLLETGFPRFSGVRNNRGAVAEKRSDPA